MKFHATRYEQELLDFLEQVVGGRRELRRAA